MHQIKIYLMHSSILNTLFFNFQLDTSYENFSTYRKMKEWLFIEVIINYDEEAIWMKP